MVYHHNHVPICGISSFQFQAPNPTAEVQGQLVVILVWHNLACGRRNKKGEARRALVMNPLKFCKYSILYIYISLQDLQSTMDKHRYESWLLCDCCGSTTLRESMTRLRLSPSDPCLVANGQIGEVQGCS